MMSATLLSSSKFQLAVVVLLAVAQRCVAPPKAATKADTPQPKGLTPAEKIQKIADFAYDTKGCVEYERFCFYSNLGSLKCAKRNPTGGAVFSVSAVQLAQVLNPNTRSDSGDPTLLMIDHSFCKAGQKEWANRIFSKARFIEYMTTQAHHIAELIDNGGFIGNLIVWMGKQADFGSIPELSPAEKELLARDDAQAELMVKFIFDEQKGGSAEFPARPACEEVKKTCATSGLAADQIVKLVLLDCTKPDSAKSVKILPQQLSAIGTQAGTRLVDLLCAQWPEEDVCDKCSRAKLKAEMMEDMLNVRIALKNASVKGKLTAFTNDWMIKFLEPKRGGSGGTSIGLGGGGAAPSR